MRARTMKTRASRTRAQCLIIPAVLLSAMIGSVGQAQTGMAATGGENSGWLPGLGMLVGACFALLVLWGLTQGLQTFFSDSRLAPERRPVLRWIGLNFLEPGFTVGLMIFAFGRVQSSPWQAASHPTAQISPIS